MHEGNIPHHVGIIMDGNGRWAEERGLARTEGHLAGYERLKELAPFIFEQGVEVLTVFAFSTENWNREEKEIAFLFDLFRMGMEEVFPELTRENIRIRFIGRRFNLPADLQESMLKLERESVSNTRGTLVVAIDYGGRNEIVRAVRHIEITRLFPGEITEDLISQNLDTHGLPDVDLVIRTSGEQRMSGFLLWQASYAELYFSDKYWPDFSNEDMLCAIEWFSKRERRYGGPTSR